MQRCLAQAYCSLRALMIDCNIFDIVLDLVQSTHCSMN